MMATKLKKNYDAYKFASIFTYLLSYCRISFQGAFVYQPHSAKYKSSEFLVVMYRQVRVNENK